MELNSSNSKASDRVQSKRPIETPGFLISHITALASATGEKRHPRESGGEAPRLHRTGGEAPCSIEGRKTRREENVSKGVENLPALLYTIV